MQPQWKNTDSHGLKPMKICLSVGLNTKEVIIFKKYLKWNVKETGG
jgi:hypothetical protein